MLTDLNQRQKDPLEFGAEEEAEKFEQELEKELVQAEEDDDDEEEDELDTDAVLEMVAEEEE